MIINIIKDKSPEPKKYSEYKGLSKSVKIPHFTTSSKRGSNILNKWMNYLYGRR